MLYLFRLLLFLINIDQETVLNWFGIEDATKSRNSGSTIKSDNYDFSLSNVDIHQLIYQLIHFD